jgi:flavin reductase (DIM6/NTAB) family NADH-FMN oxidoreductase RutF
MAARARIPRQRNLVCEIDAPSSNLAMITATEPVYIVFTANLGTDTARNTIETGEFVANLPPFDRGSLE